MSDSARGNEPDFHALARLWLARDPRARTMNPDEQTRIVGRLAEALKKRRESTDHSHQDVGLIVNVDRDHLVPGKGLSDEAFTQLLGFLQERLENPDKSEDPGLEKPDS
ncbi:MAG: hypothetical protein WC314_17020 [Vulcanimicrobiota bacterium]